MTKKIIFILSCFFTLTQLHAQQHDYNWIFGYGPTAPGFGNSIMNFNYSPPLISPIDWAINFSFFNGSCSDSTGNLIFFTDGLRIYDRFNEIMENGDTINPGPIWNNSQNDGYLSARPIFALPKPAGDSIYYLFHSGSALGNATVIAEFLYYSVIDMKANNGNGKVMEKNVVMMEGDLMWPAAVKHGNGRDWWIMGLQKSDTKHYLFLLSPQGITGPYIQDIGPPFDTVEYAGKSLFSQDGSLYLRHDTNKALRLYDFDRCTGQLSNLRIIPQPEVELPSWIAAFSPDDRFLYLNRPGWVRTLDLWEEDLTSTYDTLSNWELNFCPSYPWQSSYFFCQLAPDGKIYYSNAMPTRCLNTVHRPDLPGDAADCEEAAVILPGFNAGTLTQFPNYRLGEWDGSPCDTVNFQRPGDGFLAKQYAKGAAGPAGQPDRSYTLLPTLPGSPCEGCSKKDLEMLRNPMAFVYAQYIFQTTGRPPADWPAEQAEREGIYLVAPPKKK